MTKKKKTAQTRAIKYSILNILLVVTGIALRCNGIFLLVAVTWANLFVYSIEDIRNRSMLFAFAISFFTFLIGRDFLEEFFKYKIENFEVGILNHTYLCVFLGIATIAVGYVIYEKIFSPKHKPKKQRHLCKNETIFRVSRIAYYSTWIFAIISMLITVKYVSENNYENYYVGYSRYLSENFILYVISKIGSMMPVAFCILCASFPNKQEFKLPCILYLIYLALSLLSGQRSIIILGLMLIMVYFCIRDKEEKGVWIKRKYYIAGLIALPILAAFFSIYSIWRMGAGISPSTAALAIPNFVYDQGVSSNAIKRAYEHRDEIPKQLYTSEFLHSGLQARVLGIPVYQGNSVDHALYGGSLAHSLGYVVLGEKYLNGRGTGSSYIAELFQDFGYVGIIIGSLFYLVIIISVNRIGYHKNTIITAIIYCMITQIIWAPRASFSGFITYLIAPFTILTFAIIFGLGAIIEHKKPKKNHEE